MGILERIENNIEWYYKNHLKRPGAINIGKRDFAELKNDERFPRVVEYDKSSLQYKFRGILIRIQHKFERHLSYE